MFTTIALNSCGSDDDDILNLDNDSKGYLMINGEKYSTEPPVWNAGYTEDAHSNLEFSANLLKDNSKYSLAFKIEGIASKKELKKGDIDINLSMFFENNNMSQMGVKNEIVGGKVSIVDIGTSSVTIKFDNLKFTQRINGKDVPYTLNGTLKFISINEMFQ